MDWHATTILSVRTGDRVAIGGDGQVTLGTQVMKADAVKSHNLVPKKEQNLPPDQQAAMTASYQKDMDAFTADIDTLSTDIQADKWTAARADFQKLLTDEKSGHKAYRIKKD